MKHLYALILLALVTTGLIRPTLADDGANPCAQGDTACLEQQKKDKKPAVEEEEPECD